jgi:hypothetical protein
MQHADTLTVIRHDDSTDEYHDVRYTITRAGLHILAATGDETSIDAFDVLTSHAARQHNPGTENG